MSGVRPRRRPWRQLWSARGAKPSWRLRALAGAAVALALTAAACMALPLAQDAPAPVPLAAAKAGATLIGAQGPVSDAQKARDLTRVEGEGRAALVQHHLAVLAAQGELDLYRGNAVRLLVDGPATFAAMKAAIAQARQRVLVEFYIVEDDGVAAEFAELLMRKASEGVAVALMYDSIGSMDSDAAFFERLRAGGVAVCAFNPVNPLHRPGAWGLLERNHRKMVSVDNEIAFTGGINLSNVYASGSRGSGGSGGSRGGSGPGGSQARAADDLREGWRDTQIELRGPVVTAMSTLFRQSWTAQACPGTLPPPPPPRQAAPGQRIVKLVAGDPAHGVNPTYTTLLAATAAAKESVKLTMAYFAPGADMVRTLADAARRGVKVQLVLPGRSDVTLVLQAGRSYYTELLEAGVQIHEMPSAVLHAKTAVIDGVLATVGSSNLDWRSIVGNREIDVIVLGDDFGQALEQLFQADLAMARRIELAQWQRRGFGQRFMESVGRLLEPVL